jgi:SAM-dependent methyltransferase
MNATHTIPDTHLDLGCGKFPRNPYGRAKLYGIDIREIPGLSFELRIANLSVEPIPYGDNQFGSISAYDFLEHIPRVIISQSGETIFPFINVMNEAWRVLAPNGLFYALTPAFPHPDVFTDPTHVNFITDKTHEYFCGTNSLGGMYGFKGQFELIRCQRAHHSSDYIPSALHSSAKNKSLVKKFAHGLRDVMRKLRGKKTDPNEGIAMPYLLWEFRAIK